MFKAESEFQELIHNNPEILLSGILEINPRFCPDTPTLLSLGREIPLSSGPIDNMYIDVNGVITFVECKRYSDARIKREVYSQAVNYASDLKNLLIHYTGEDFIKEFFQIVSKAQGFPFESFEGLLSCLSDDPLLSGKNLNDWEGQFTKRLENNIKQGICRIIIACAPSVDRIFAYSPVRNLMQIITFTETSNNNYDLILLDTRKENEEYISRIIWRNYSPLPQIPLIAQAQRNTAARIEDMNGMLLVMPEKSKQLLEKVFQYLNDRNIYPVENTYGYALYSGKNNKSSYVVINIKKDGWEIIRRQIRSPEYLFEVICSSKLQSIFNQVEFSINEKKTSKFGEMYEIKIQPKVSSLASDIGGLVVKYLMYGATFNQEQIEKNK